MQYEIDNSLGQPACNKKDSPLVSSMGEFSFLDIRNITIPKYEYTVIREARALITCINRSPYAPGESVMALSYFAPDFHAGSIGTVISRANGGLFAIRTQTGDIFKWFATWELEAADPERHRLAEGEYAYIITDRLEPILEAGALVQIVKELEHIDFYEVGLRDFPEKYRVTGFDITRQL
jgi:hypothetical protein